MSNETNTEELERLAKAAAPGPWRRQDFRSSGEKNGIDDSDGDVVCASYGRLRPKSFDFIAAANPSAVIALVDRLKKAEAEVEQFRTDARRFRLAEKNLFDAQEAAKTIAKQAIAAEAERDALAAKLAELEGQEPVAWVEVVSTHEGPYNFQGMALLGKGTHLLYARPVPAESVNARLLDALKRAKDSLVAFKFVPGGANCWEASDEENLTAVNSAIAAAEAAHTEPVNVDFGKRGENMFFKIGNQSFLLDYKPEEQDEFDCMKAMLLSAFSRITHGVKTEIQPVNARLLEALRGCLEHMEHSTQQGRHAFHEAQATIAAAEAQQERLMQDMHDAGREIDRVMAECFLTDWEKEQIHRQAESDAFNDLLGSLKEVCKTFSSTNRLWKDSAVQVMAQRSIARAEAALSALQPDVDGWIPWDGFHFPIQDGVAHQVRFRDGEVSEVDYEASGWPWMHDGDDSDIVAYRVVKP